MGCFLTCTAKDLEQFRRTVTQAASARNVVSEERSRREVAKEEYLKQAELRKEAYRNSRAEMSRAQKGDWGEVTLRAEMHHQHGHQVLMEHTGTSTKPGYDGVTFVEKNGRCEVHIWEVKNYSSKDGNSASEVRSLSAFSERRDVPNSLKIVEAIRENVMPQSPELAAQLIEAIQKGDVCWHIRLGPETDIGIDLLETFRNSPTSVDVKSYTYRDMLDARAGNWGQR